MAALPDELLFEVLLLSPAKSIGRFRCVCKSWHNLLTSSDFLNIYKNTHTKILISSFFAPIWFQSMNCNSPVIEKVKIPSFCRWQRIVHLFTSCDGLVLSILDGHLFLWNPTTNDCMKLPSIQHDLSRFFGLGYVSSMDDFRVVRGGKSGVKIYSRRSNSWKTILQFPVDVGDIWKMVGTGFNGFLHWIVFTEGMEGRKKGIISLDLETEEYKVLPQPDDMTAYNRYVLIYLGVLEGFLCAVYDYYGEGSKVWTIWVMEEYGVKDSWFRILKIPRLNISNMVIPLSVTNGEIIMQVDYEKIVKYNPISEEFKTLVDSQFCIESLVYSERLTASIDAKGKEIYAREQKNGDLCKGTKETFEIL